MGIESKFHSYGVEPQLNVGSARALRGVRRAAYTLWFPPPNEGMQSEVASLTARDPQPLQPAMGEILQGLHSEVAPMVDPAKTSKLKGAELIQMAGVLINFTDHVPLLQPFAETPYRHVQSLHEAFINKSSTESKSLTYTDQLGIALGQTKGDLPEALWRLFITSRLYARWLDVKPVSGMPSFDRAEKAQMMIDWQDSLAACKPFEEGKFQDASGDTYYTWTHAIAKVVYNELPARPNSRTRMASRTFHNGTRIMHKAVHMYVPQDVINDHTVAADYGNAIGEACVGILANKSSLTT